MNYTTLWITILALLVGIMLVILLRKGWIKSQAMTDLASVATIVSLLIAAAGFVIISPLDVQLARMPVSEPQQQDAQGIVEKAVATPLILTATLLPLDNPTSTAENTSTDLPAPTNTVPLIPTSTEIPLPTNTSTTVPIVAAVATPTAPLLPTPEPTQRVCNLSAGPIFYNFYQNHKTSLGCPTTDQISIDMISEQIFQGGHLYWRRDKNIVYIVYDREVGGGEVFLGRWEKNVDEALGRRWDWGEAGEPEPNGIGLTPPSGMFEPIRGFGWLWRNYLGRENGLLGWGLDVAYARDRVAQAQEFENGLMFKASDSLVYVLLNNGHFFSAR